MWVRIPFLLDIVFKSWMVRITLKAGPMSYLALPFLNSIHLIQLSTKTRGLWNKMVCNKSLSRHDQSWHHLKKVLITWTFERSCNWITKSPTKNLPRLIWAWKWIFPFLSFDLLISWIPVSWKWKWQSPNKLGRLGKTKKCSITLLNDLA